MGAPRPTASSSLVTVGSRSGSMRGPVVTNERRSLPVAKAARVSRPNGTMELAPGSSRPDCASSSESFLEPFLESFLEPFFASSVPSSSRP